MTNIIQNKIMKAVHYLSQKWTAFLILNLLPFNFIKNSNNEKQYIW